MKNMKNLHEDSSFSKLQLIFSMFSIFIFKRNDTNQTEQFTWISIIHKIYLMNYQMNIVIINTWIIDNRLNELFIILLLLYINIMLDKMFELIIILTAIIMSCII